MRVADGVGWLTLNRPAQINAINDDVRRGVPHALLQFAADDRVRAVVICGAGARGFCAGADIKEMRSAESVAATRSRMASIALYDAIEQFAKPIIAAVHGVCMGIALACDIRLASEDALFALPEVNLGLIPGGGGTQRLARLVGMGAALDLILTGDRVSAADAHRLGLVTRIFPSHDTLMGEALSLAERIAAKPPVAARLAKEAVRRGGDLDLRNGLRVERDLFVMAMATDDRIEAAQAFREKRAPNFRGS